MEERKIKEIEYYDKEAEESQGGEVKEAGSRGEFDPLVLESYRFLYKVLAEKGGGKKILDYGCGTGVHLANLGKTGKEIMGIDLSYKSLELAQNRIREKNLQKKARVLLMDCEELEFEDNSFDVVFDGGTFSSLDMKKVLPELSRVLRPKGFLIGIETFGHNPFTNLKRKINIMVGSRTSWAAGHILKTSDLKAFENYFGRIETHFFHIVSWAAFPFLNLPGGKFLLKLLEKTDRFLIRVFPFLKKYSFKVVFVLSYPKK
jgi:SAM-dependent methyltransferase